ncbi:geranylgeranyl transferase type-1 subunit beta [Anaeramoeba ignava]|uniref:Geranylgeranyl transferase type-1 subunit beta n=1 Tax=Anaeramoeba ignava TaxID=1746090 RepID=A0A9Q0LQA2_ANAIG|nr:geranylgeranyl transferase type-1 subunit beta [Anaeramoeba ignava]
MEQKEEKKKKELIFKKKQHIEWIKRFLKLMPTETQDYDSNRMTMLYFVVSSLDLLGEVDNLDKKSIIDFVYSQQILPDKDNPEKYIENCGFRGGQFFGRDENPQCQPTNSHLYDHSHIAMTYVAIAILTILGDDYSRLNKNAILTALKSLQLDDGSFLAINGIYESDMRYLYCACCISKMLNDWSGVNIEKATKYILSAQSYENGFGLLPGRESHGGSTYCALASLSMMGTLNQISSKDKVIEWLIRRQLTGFEGRTNKMVDTCYSFWIGASLKLFNVFDLIDFEQCSNFTLSTQGDYGGFAKWPDIVQDPLHTYFGLCGLGFMKKFDIPEVDPELGFRIKK